MSTSDSGSTLIELLVVLGVLALVAGVAVTVLPSRARAPRGDGACERVTELRRRALVSGMVQTDTLTVGASTRLATALSDGQIIVSSGYAQRIQRCFDHAQ